MKRILFVCLGNIVRSPLAENIFRHLASEAGVGDRFEVDSAGIGGWHVGERPDPRMRQVAAKKGMVYDGEARQIDRRDLERFDLIVAMDTDNRQDLLDMTSTPEQRRRICLLREYDSQGDVNASVPDPYYGGMDGFENVYAIIQRSVQCLFDTLQTEQNA